MRQSVLQNALQTITLCTVRSTAFTSAPENTASTQLASNTAHATSLMRTGIALDVKTLDKSQSTTLMETDTTLSMPMEETPSLTIALLSVLQAMSCLTMNASNVDLEPISTLRLPDASPVRYMMMETHVLFVMRTHA